ncbi:hypothetical protein JH06_1833 [Blastocystis sp. subtype 4]|uniref:hypothetical protein n=1 Tax=Blastocystis sp. subtype 4 TaxID=944170 RepID=UPI0007113040|nr:hypothetical protein JH06_1833 [Blastocystis sp. subtype 4]KNB44581.1 hypothetical protein JH06_1833 [Blastocystis sp. subtype 4]|eukprot:XP_014528022.1 hypothetical protein JH06_1833 [Blastocystis sp. subtype 4]
MKKRGTLFREDALDYFVFTSSTYNLSSLLDVVIGRPLYDNYLLHIISNDTEADLVDATESGWCVTAFHQTDEDGIFAGHKPKEDLNWNRKLIKKQFVLGNTNFSDYRIVDGFKLVKHEKPEWSVCSELSRHIRERMNKALRKVQSYDIESILQFLTDNYVLGDKMICLISNHTVTYCAQIVLMLYHFGNTSDVILYQETLLSIYSPKLQWRHIT